MKLKVKNGIPYPAKMKFNSWIVVGPPGIGKSYLIDKIGGYPGEVAIDIAEKKWWTVEPLIHRPREIHFVFPFKGHEKNYSVYDDVFKGNADYPALDFERIQIPHKKQFIIAPNWRARFVFDFVLPPPLWAYETRKNRLISDDKRLVDLDLTIDWLTWQLHVYWEIAWHFHNSGLQVMIRPFTTARPYSFRVIEKIMIKKHETIMTELTPSSDWASTRVIKQWFEQSSPSNLLKENYSGNPE